MKLDRRDVGAAHWVRICLTCGHDGPELQRHVEDAVFVCPMCGEDLYARPPRSYAEMELLDAVGEDEPAPQQQSPRPTVVIRAGPQTRASPLRSFFHSLVRWRRPGRPGRPPG